MGAVSRVGMVAPFLDARNHVITFDAGAALNSSVRRTWHDPGLDSDDLRAQIRDRLGRYRDGEVAAIADEGRRRELAVAATLLAPVHASNP